MKKKYDLSNIDELVPSIVASTVEELITPDQEDELTDSATEEKPEPREYKTIATTSLVTVVAYMMGLDEDRLNEYYHEHNADLIEQLKNSREATIVRYLNRLRTAIMLNFKNVDNEMLYNLGNIDRMPWFNINEINTLRKWGIEVVQTNYRADKYVTFFCGLIAEKIDACKSLFPDWVNFEYIKDLFVVPKCNRVEVMKGEYTKFKANINLYPFQMYIHWQPGEYGNILYADGKLLAIIYEQHGDVFLDRSKYRDAVEGTKKNIYEYIDKSGKVIIAVDCENSDVYKLHGVLKNLDQEEIEKIEKIVLYDDYHTTAGWDWLEKFVNIPVEHIEIDRVTDHKSLVDVRMTAGICQAFYRDNVDSFILCSSDSDFWGVISAIPEANFLVLYEYSKCGRDIKEALTLRNIYHCSMDDFYTGNTGEIQKVVLKKALEAEAENLVGKNAYEMVESIYSNNHIDATEREKQNFFEKYVKTMRLKINDDGCFYIDIVQ